MIQQLLFVSWALVGSVLAKSVFVCDQQSEWLGANTTVFQEPLTDSVSSYIFIDTPSQLSADNSTCECAPIFGVVSNWMTNGTWAADDVTGECVLTCDRCQVYYCTHNFQDGLMNTTNVTFTDAGESTCILPEDIPVTTTTIATTDVATETTDDITLDVEIHITQGNTTSNYTLEYPVPTVTISTNDTTVATDNATVIVSTSITVETITANSA